MIAQEGSPLVMVVAGASLVSTITSSWWLAGIGWTVVAALVFLFRDSRHKIPPVPLGIVSPANAIVSEIKTVDDPWLERRATRVRTRIPALGPFALFSPIEGKVVRQWTGHCTGANAIEHEGLCQTAWIQTDEGDDVIFVIHPRARANRLQCRTRTGERVGQGQRCGFMIAGGVIDILVSEDTLIDVEVGQSLEAAADIVATIVHRGDVRRDPGAIPQSI